MDSTEQNMERMFRDIHSLNTVLGDMVEKYIDDNPIFYIKQNPDDLAKKIWDDNATSICAQMYHASKDDPRLLAAWFSRLQLFDAVMLRLRTSCVEQGSHLFYPDGEHDWYWKRENVYL